jgi:hypothetical protein
MKGLTTFRWLSWEKQKPYRRPSMVSCYVFVRDRETERQRQKDETRHRERAEKGMVATKFEGNMQ